MDEANVMDSPEVGGPEEFEGGTGSEDGAAGSGQSKSSRRRRRKRRNKMVSQGVVIEGGADEGADSGGESAAGLVPMEGESLGQRRGRDHGAAAPQSAGNPAAQNASPNGNQAPAPQGSGTGKRWKKKFRDRERRPRNENPGNQSDQPQSFSNNGGGYGNGGGNGFKRKNKGGGGGGRSFVGPMDHSYREVNGNFADAPPSTIQVHHGQRRQGKMHRGDSQPIDHSMPRAIPLPPNAQTHIYLFVEDLFVTAKVQETARKQGVKVAFVKNDKESLAELMADRETDKPGLIVIDLNNAAAKPMTLIPKLKTKFKKSVSIIGFLSQIQGDLKAKAMEVGCDTIMPRAAFSQNLANLLRRYGAEEDEEQNFNY